MAAIGCTAGALSEDDARTGMDARADKFREFCEAAGQLAGGIDTSRNDDAAAFLQCGLHAGPGRAVRGEVAGIEGPGLLSGVLPQPF